MNERLSAESRLLVVMGEKRDLAPGVRFVYNLIIFLKYHYYLISSLLLFCYGKKQKKLGEMDL